MTPTPKKPRTHVLNQFAKIALTAPFALIAVSVPAVTLDFNTAGDFAANFRAIPMSTGNTFSQTGQVVTITGNNAGTPALLFVYDTTPSNNVVQNSFGLTVGQTISVSIDIGNISATGTGSSVGFYFGSPTNEAGAVNFMALLNVNGSGANEQFRFSRAATIGVSNPNGTLTNGTPTLADGGISLLDSTFRTITASYTYNSASSITMSLMAGAATSTHTYTGVTALSDVIIGFRVSPTANATLTTLQLDNFAIIAPIPEPSAFAALAGLGVLGLAVTRRRRHCR